LTTVAYRDGVLASDSKSSGDNIYDGNVIKVRKIKAVEELSWIDRIIKRKEPQEISYLVGYAGAVADCLDYIDCIFAGAPQNKNTYESNILSICEDGTITLYDGSSLRGIEVTADFISIGSGGPIAQGAMFHGASAVEAVKAAIYLDNMSGGDIQIVTFDSEDEDEE